MTNAIAKRREKVSNNLFTLKVFLYKHIHSMSTSFTVSNKGKWKITNRHSIAFKSDPRRYTLHTHAPPLNPLVDRTPFYVDPSDFGPLMADFISILTNAHMDGQLTKKLVNFKECYDRRSIKERGRRTFSNMAAIRLWIKDIMSIKVDDPVVIDAYEELAQYIHVVFVTVDMRSLYHPHNILYSALYHLRIERGGGSSSRAQALIPQCWVRPSVLNHDAVHKAGPLKQPTLVRDDQDIRSLWQIDQESYGGPKKPRRSVPFEQETHSQKLKMKPELSQTVIERVAAKKKERKITGKDHKKRAIYDYFKKI